MVDPQSGDILNKYNYSRMFASDDLDQTGEVPMPFRVERHNFNPHEIFGCFDYEKITDKPILLKDKEGRLVDKFLRKVNKAGYLEDEFGNVIDN